MSVPAQSLTAFNPERWIGGYLNAIVPLLLLLPSLLLIYIALRTIAHTYACKFVRINAQICVRVEAYGNDEVK